MHKKRKKKNKQKKKSSKKRTNNKFEYFLESKKEIILYGLWFANLYLITKIFGNYMGIQFSTFLAILGTIFIYVIKDIIEVGL